MSSELLTTAETAAVLRKSIRTVTRMVERGELPYVRKLTGTNGGFLFDRAVVDLLARQQARAATS